MDRNVVFSSVIYFPFNKRNLYLATVLIVILLPSTPNHQTGKIARTQLLAHLTPKNAFC